MDDRTRTPRRRSGLDGWSIAAALGLMAATFLIDRLTPVDKEDRPKPAKNLPPQSDTQRDTSAAGLAAEREDRRFEPNAFMFRRARLLG